MKNKKDAQTSGLLNKKISELTLEDIQNLEKPLGTSSRPFPMWGPQRVEHDGRTDVEVLLSRIADDSHPLRILSERSYEEVVAMAYTDMPVPSMLDIFMEGLERRADPILRQKDILEGRTPQNENYNRTQMMLGDPGHGKSFLGALMGRMRAKGSVEVYDCGGKNMNDLLFEMVLDFGAGDALPRAIDKRLQAGSLEQMSLGLLKALPNGAVSTDAAGEIVGIDWNFFKTASNDDVQSAYDTLKKVSSIEGLDNAGGNALGMNSQYGALIRAFLENREIVLDEYNKSREGSDNALQTVIQFLIGEISHCTVDNPLKNKDNTSGPSSFTFKRSDMGAGFFVTFTGNKTEDGTTTRSLNKSVYDRLKPDTLPDPDIIDWQHRICQMMVGLPVSTLYHTFQEQADEHPEAFGEWLMWLRQTKAKIEGTPVPELQETLLSNWMNVVNASDKLARFYDRWAELTDANKITSNGNSDLIEEVDEEYSKKEAMSFRRIKQHLEESIPLRPKMQPQDAPVAFDKGAWSKPPQLAERVEENASLHFGSRLVDYLEAMIYKKSGAVGKDKLYGKLRKSMDEFGLREISLSEGARSRQRSVEEDLNISAFADRDLGKQAQMARKIFCEYLRQVDPEIQATDDQIVTVRKFLDALEGVIAADTVPSNELFVVNRDHESLAAGAPLTGASIKDAALYSLENRDGLDFTIDNLVSHDDFLASLALPTVGKKNLQAVWESNIRRLWEPAAGDATADGASLTDHDEAMRIAENKSETGLAVTTLRVATLEEGEPGVASVHIIANAARGRTLVIGDRLPSKLQAAFNEAGITHVDRNDANAKTRVDTALTDLTRNMPATTRDRLRDAFLYRNNVDVPAFAGKTPKLVDMLVEGSVETIYDKYVVKNDNKPVAPRKTQGM